MSTSLFPDVNVWAALSHTVHPHHAVALAWADAIGNVDPVCFCRFTQLGLLRILTTRAAMGNDVMTQARAWQVYDTFHRNPNTLLVPEPTGLELGFRTATSRDEVSPKLWADAYLSSFAEAAGYTLVTFDKALAARATSSILLRG